MNNDKSPDNDDIRKEFYITYWDTVKELLYASIHQSFIVGQLSTSQKHAIIKLLIEKKDRDKRLIKNCRPGTSKHRYETNLEGTS